MKKGILLGLLLTSTTHAYYDFYCFMEPNNWGIDEITAGATENGAEVTFYGLESTETVSARVEDTSYQLVEGTTQNTYTTPNGFTIVHSELTAPPWAKITVSKDNQTLECIQY